MLKRRFTNKIKTSGMLFLAVLMFITTCIQPHHIYAVSQPSVVYSTHMQDYGWLSEKENGATGGITNEPKHIEAVKINLKNSPYSGDIAYVVHVQDRGWTGWARNGNIAGTTGQNKKIEAIEIRLTGEIAQYYNIEYRAYVNGSGWQGWVKNGRVAGTVGQNKGIQAIEVKLTEKTDDEKNNKDFSVIKSSDLHTQGNKLVLFSEPDITDFSVTTNADSSRASKYTIPKNAPGTTNYVETITKRYFSFQEKYGAMTLKIKDIKSTDTVTASYKHVGTYNGRDIDMKMEFSNMVYRHSPYYPDDGYAYITISESPYSGYLYGNLAYLYVDYTFTYSDTGETVSFGERSYITVNSLNAYEGEGMGEYVRYLNSEGAAYVKDDTNVELKEYSNLPVSPVFVGLYEDFNDELGRSTFTRNSVQFQISGTTQKFFVGAGRSSAWNTISSGVLFKVTAPPPIKDVLNSSRQSINNQDVKVNQELIYRIGQPVHVLGQDILDKYQSFVIKDTLPDNVTFKKAEIVDENGNVVDNPGSISYNQSSREVTFTANSDFLNNYIKYNGETYYLDIHVTVADKKADSDSSNIVVSNQASSTINGVTKTSNKVANTIKTYNVNVKHVFEKDNTVLKEYNDKKYDGESYSYSPETITYNNGANSYIPVDETVTGSIDHQDVNIVFHYKRPAIGVNLAKVQIYTNKFRDGLPTDVYMTIDTDDRAYLAGKIITLSIKDKTSNRVVVNQNLDLSTINNNRIQTTIPTNDLQKNVHRTYDVSLSTSDPDVIINDGLITLDGYTSAEQTLTKHDADSNGKIRFKGVVMTEREFGRDMKTYDETLTVQYTPKQRVKSGYGYDLNMQVKYTNELMDQLVDKLGIHRMTGIRSGVDHRLIDNTLEFYDQHANYQKDDKVFFDLERKDESNSNTASTLNYYAPFTYLAQDTGLTYTKNQKERGEIHGKSIQAGHRFYVPIWIDGLGNYVVNYKSVNDIGSHHIQFDIDSVIHVYAYMFAHVDSKSIDQDELLIHPVQQDGIPDDLGK